MPHNPDFPPEQPHDLSRILAPVEWAGRIACAAGLLCFAEAGFSLLTEGDRWLYFWAGAGTGAVIAGAAVIITAEACKELRN